MKPACPSNPELTEFHAGTLDAAFEQECAEHVDACEACQAKLATLEASGSIRFAEIASRNATDSDALEQRMSELKRSIDWSDSGSTTQSELPLTDIQPWLSKATTREGAQRVDEFELGPLIGRGGMGIVFNARDTKLDREVALKFMNPGLLADRTSAERFLREAKAAAAVTHPNVVTIHAVGEFHELPYLVMELVRGESLAERISGQPLSASQLISVGLQIAEGLSAAHAAQMLHRDIKPANVLLEDRDDRVKIVDFGLARSLGAQALTQTGTMVGTPEFMAPEQFDSAKGAVDQRSDLFSLGALLYTCLTGGSPFAAPTALASLKAVCFSDPTPLQTAAPETPSWLSKAIMRMIEKEPKSRPQSAREVSELLKRQTVPPPPPQIMEKASPPVSYRDLATPRYSRIRRRSGGKTLWPMYAAGGSVLLLVVALAYTFNLPRSDGPHPVDEGKGERVDAPQRKESALPSVSDSKKAIVEADESRESLPGVYRVTETAELERVLANSDGRDLEIQLDGEEFVWPSRVVENRTVVLVGVSDVRPKLTLRVSAEDPPFIARNAVVRLEELHIQAAGQVSKDDELEGLLQFESSSVAIDACTFESDLLAPGLIFQESSATITGCDFFLPRTVCLHWNPDDEQELQLEENAFIADTLIGCSDLFGARLQLTRNRFAGSIVFECDTDEPDAELNLEMNQNLLAATHAVCVIYLSSEEGQGELPLPEFHWNGNGNLYPPHLAILVSDEDEERLFESLSQLKSICNVIDEDSVRLEELQDLDIEALEGQLDRNLLRPKLLRNLNLE